MKRFFVRYLVKTNASVIKEKKNLLSKNILGWKFVFKEKDRKETLIGVHDNKEGLLFDTLILTETLREAVDKSKFPIETTANLVSFTSGEIVEGAKFLFGYNYSPDIKERDFIQEFIIPVTKERLFHSMEESVFGEVFNAFSKENSPEIARALSWLRGSYWETNAIRKFTLLWVGLEALNDKLIEFHQLPEEQIWTRCKKCDSKISKKSTIGIQQLFLNKEIFRKIRTVRAKIFHASSPLDQDLYFSAEKYCPILRKTLVSGINLLLHVKQETLEKLVKTKEKPLTPKVKLIIQAKLIDFIPKPLEYFNSHPFVTIQQDIQSILDKDYQMKVTLKAHNASFSILKTEMWSIDKSENIIEKVKFENYKILRSQVKN